MSTEQLYARILMSRLILREQHAAHNSEKTLRTVRKSVWGARKEPQRTGNKEKDGFDFKKKGRPRCTQRDAAKQ